MTPVIPASTEMLGGILLIAAAIGIIGMGVMGLSQAYHNPLFAFLSYFPGTGFSTQNYDLPDEGQREQLAQFPELEDLDVRVHNSDSEVSGGMASGFEFGPIGVPGIVLTASAFDNPEHLAAIIFHELGHQENGDMTINAFYIMMIGGLILFALSLFVAMGLIIYSTVLIDVSLRDYLDVLIIISIVFIISIAAIIYTNRRFRDQYYDAEYDADRRAVQRLGSPECLKTLLRHYSDNRDEKKDDNPGPISQFLGGRMYPHPDERLEKIKKS